MSLRRLNKKSPLVIAMETATISPSDLIEGIDLSSIESLNIAFENYDFGLPTVSTEGIISVLSGKVKETMAQWTLGFRKWKAGGWSALSETDQLRAVKKMNVVFFTNNPAQVTNLVSFFENSEKLSTAILANQDVSKLETITLAIGKNLAEMNKGLGVDHTSSDVKVLHKAFNKALKNYRSTTIGDASVVPKLMALFDKYGTLAKSMTPKLEAVKISVGMEDSEHRDRERRARISFFISLVLFLFWPTILGFVFWALWVFVISDEYIQGSVESVDLDKELTALEQYIDVLNASTESATLSALVLGPSVSTESFGEKAKEIGKKIWQTILAMIEKLLTAHPEWGRKKDRIEAMFSKWTDPYFPRGITTSSSLADKRILKHISFFYLADKKFLKSARDALETLSQYSRDFGTLLKELEVDGSEQLRNIFDLAAEIYSNFSKLEELTDEQLFSQSEKIMAWVTTASGKQSVRSGYDICSSALESIDMLLKEIKEVMVRDKDVLSKETLRNHSSFVRSLKRMHSVFSNYADTVNSLAGLLYDRNEKR